MGILFIVYQCVFQIITITGLLFIGIISELSKMKIPENSSLYLVSDLASLISGIIFLILHMKNKKDYYKLSKKHYKMKVHSFAFLFSLLIGWNCFLSTFSFLFRHITGLPLQAPQGTDNAFVNPVILFILISVFPGIFEELIFRGVLFRYLRKNGYVFAAVISSLVFGLMHMNFLQLFFASGMGLFFTYIYEKYGKLRYCILLHVMNNSIPVLYNVCNISDKTIVLFEGIVALIFIIVIVTVCVSQRDSIADKIKVNTNQKIRIRDFYITFFMIIFTLLMLGGCMMCMFV